MEDYYGIFINDKTNLLKWTEMWTAPRKNGLILSPSPIQVTLIFLVFLPNNFQLDQFPDPIPCAILRLPGLAQR